MQIRSTGLIIVPGPLSCATQVSRVVELPNGSKSEREKERKKESETNEPDAQVNQCVRLVRQEGTCVGAPEAV